MKLKLAPDLQLPLDAVTQTFGILAKRGSGKTYTAAVFAEELLKAGQQVVIVDPVGVWWGLRAAADGRGEGLSILVMGGEHGDLPLEATAGELMADVVVEQGRAVVLDLSVFRKAETTRFMTDFLETLYRRSRSPLQLIVDEADAMAPQRPLPGEQRLLGAMEDIVRRGRARGIGCTLITQRPAVLNKNVLTQIEVLICLRLIAPQDRAAVMAWVEVHGTEAQKRELLDSLPALPIGTAWFWSPAAGIFQKVKVRRRETFDSSATPKAGERVAAPKRLAPVDLEALREQMAATIEEAAARDPKALQRKVAALEGELEELRARPAAVEAAPAPLMNEEQFAELRTLANVLPELMVNFHGKLVEVVALASSGEARAETCQPALPDRAVVPAPPRNLHNVHTAQTSSSEGVPPRHQALLNSLAAFEAMKLSDVGRGQLAIFCDRSPNSSGYANDLGAMRTAGLISYPAGDRVQLTPAGRELARHEVRYRTQGELHDVWFAKLPRRQADIVRALVQYFPKAVRREELAAAVSKSAASSGYANDLGALRSLGVLDYPSGGHVRATELLFPPLPR